METAFRLEKVHLSCHTGSSWKLQLKMDLFPDCGLGFIPKPKRGISHGKQNWFL